MTQASAIMHCNIYLATLWPPPHILYNHIATTNLATVYDKLYITVTLSKKEKR